MDVITRIKLLMLKPFYHTRSWRFRDMSLTSVNGTISNVFWYSGNKWVSKRLRTYYKKSTLGDLSYLNILTLRFNHLPLMSCLDSLNLPNNYGYAITMAFLAGEISGKKYKTLKRKYTRHGCDTSAAIDDLAEKIHFVSKVTSVGRNNFCITDKHKESYIIAGRK